MLLKCLETNKAKLAIIEVHEGIYSTHQSGIKMRWLIHRYGYFWLTILQDYIIYVQGCEACQQYGLVPRVPAANLQFIIKP